MLPAIFGAESVYLLQTIFHDVAAWSSPPPWPMRYLIALWYCIYVSAQFVNILYAHDADKFGWENFKWSLWDVIITFGSLAALGFIETTFPWSLWSRWHVRDGGWLSISLAFAMIFVIGLRSSKYRIDDTVNRDGEDQKDSHHVLLARNIAMISGLVGSGSSVLAHILAHRYGLALTFFVIPVILSYACCVGCGIALYLYLKVRWGVPRIVEKVK
jgi:hypothetical protein